MRTTVPVIGLLLLGHSLLAGCGVGEAKIVNKTLPPAPLPVDGVSVAVTELYASYNATSTLAADGEAQVPARVAGQVVEILVEEGDAVVQGQILARLDGERLRLSMLAAQAQLAKRRNEYERQQKLHARGIVSAAAFDSLKFEVEALDAAWRLERLNLSYAEIRAPITGVVAAREIKVGDQLKPQQLAFRISDTSRLLAEIRVPQSELYRLRPGQPVRLAVDAIEHTQFAAVVDRISPTIDPQTGTFGLTSYIDNADGRLAPGMFARLSVAYEVYGDALVLPASAIIEEDGQFVVYVVSDGTAERRAVEPGIRQHGLVQIVAGVSAGDLVIRDSGGIRDGTRVIAAAATPVPTGG